jgi:hypothetical protein
MLKPSHEDTKKAIIGAIIALIVSFIGFAGNWAYKNISESSDLKIADAEPILILRNNTPISRFTIDSYKNYQCEIASDFETIALLIKKEELSSTEIKTLLKLLENRIRDSVGIRLCKSSLNLISCNQLNIPTKQKWQIDSLDYKSSCDIKRKLEVDLSNQRELYNLYKSAFDSVNALRDKNIKRLVSINFIITITNNGNYPGTIIPTRTIVDFNGKKIKYTCPDKIPICLKPNEQSANNLITLIPAPMSSGEINNWNNIIQQGGKQRFTIILETNSGKTIKTTEQLKPL